MKFPSIISLLLFVLPVTGQVPLTLEQANERAGADYHPAHLGEYIVIQGVVSSIAIPVVNYSLLPIEDETGHGFVLEDTIGSFNHFAEGDFIRASGNVVTRAGMPVLRPDEIRRLGHKGILPPRHVALRDVNSFRCIGSSVVTEGQVLNTGENMGGLYIEVGEPGNPVMVFLPHLANPKDRRFVHLKRGDLVRISGLASQYCPLPPFNRYFQILISKTDSVTLLERSWPIPTWATLTALGTFCLLLLLWTLRERQMSAKRRSLRSLYRIGEEIVAARSTQESLRILQSALPQAVGSAWATIYAYDHKAKTLQRIEEEGPFAAEGPVFPPDAAMSCWRNRSLLVIPNIQQSPFYEIERTSGRSGTAMFVPMFAQDETVGVLQVEGALSRKHFDADVQAVAQHLANQIAIGIKLRERQAVREQLFQPAPAKPATEAKAAPDSTVATDLPPTVRPVTSLVVEPNTENRRALIAALDSRGHRAVPAVSGEEAADKTSRFHFQVLFCSTKLPGMDCIKLLEQVRDRVDACVFMREGTEGEGTRTLPHGDGYVLTSPVRPDDLDRVLLSIQSGLAREQQ